MKLPTRRRLVLFAGVTAIAIAALAVSPPGRGVLFHVSPIRWTGEAPRLAALLKLTPGMAVADIGAGGGAMALEIAATIGPAGRIFVTERTPEQRARLAERATAHPHTVVIEALDDQTNLPDACCDAIYLRFVWHHLGNPEVYARSLARALKPGGRLAIIDFSPGAFFHLDADHGVSADEVTRVMTSAGFTVEHRDDRWGRAFAVGFKR